MEVIDRRREESSRGIDIRDTASHEQLRQRAGRTVFCVLPCPGRGAKWKIRQIAESRSQIVYANRVFRSQFPAHG
jgi:hypothetical protein